MCSLIASMVIGAKFEPTLKMFVPLALMLWLNAALPTLDALQIEQVTFQEHVMLGNVITMVCEYRYAKHYLI